MQEKILEILKRFATVEYFALRSLVSSGEYSFSTKAGFNSALIELKTAGKIVARGGIFGWLQLAPIVAVPDRGRQDTGRSGQRGRLRSSARN